MRHALLSLVVLSMGALGLHAQDFEYTVDSTTMLSRSAHALKYSTELSTTLSTGDHAPFWLTSNRHGLSSVERNSVYFRAGIFRDAHTDSTYKWRLGYGADFALAANYTSTLIVQQLYADIQYRAGELSIGAKERPMEMKNNRLSTGSQTLGINARPIPQVRIGLPDWWVVPLTRGWLQLKGHIAYGMMTDDTWQHDFTHRLTRYADHALFHSKAGYLRIANEDYDYPLSLEAGLEMAAQFGGTTYRPIGGVMTEIKNETGAKAFWHAFIPGGGDSYEKNAAFQNAEGNQLGSWMLRVNYDRRNWRLGVYIDHFFEDHSGLFHLDYDGYGTGSQWNTRKERRYLLYGLKDMLLGAELNLKRGTWLRDIVFEYMYTKYQSGPIYHDHNPAISDHIGGQDNYYNHMLYPGWQHWGQVIGNPLYRSPLYNDDGHIEIENNRFMAFHLAFSGHPTPQLDYRVLGTWQEGFGSYSRPFTASRRQLSLFAEAQYAFSPASTPLLRGWSIGLALGYDHGTIVGDNFGTQLTIRKTGILCK